MTLMKESVRSLKKNETKQRLFDAAKRLFSCHAFEAVKVEDITKEAGLAKGTFFNYFESKEDVISEMKLIQTYESLMPLLEQEGPIVPAIKHTLTHSLLHTNDSKSLMRACLMTQLKNQKEIGDVVQKDENFYRDMVRLVEKAKANGEIRKELEAPDVIRLVEQMHMGILLQWCSIPDNSSIDQYVRTSFDILFDGMKPN